MFPSVKVAINYRFILNNSNVRKHKLIFLRSYISNDYFVIFFSNSTIPLKSIIMFTSDVIVNEIGIRKRLTFKYPMFVVFVEGDVMIILIGI